MSDLHDLLDGLTDGEHIKTTWAHGAHLTATEGPVSTKGRHVWCRGVIRWNDGDINPALTSIEVARDEEVTVTRDDEKALHALLDSLEYGDTVTAELRNSEGSIGITGKVRTDGAFLEVYGYDSYVLRRHSGVMTTFLHSVTVRRTVVQRWEREGNE